MCVKSILGVKMFRCFPQVYTTRIVYCCFGVFFLFLLSVGVLCCFLLVCLHSLISPKKIGKDQPEHTGLPLLPLHSGYL